MNTENLNLIPNPEFQIPNWSECTLFSEWSVKKHCAEKILLAVLETLLY